MSENSVIVRRFNNVEISQRITDRYIDATRMCQANGKFWADYWRIGPTQEFLAELSSDTGIPITGLVEVRQGGLPSEQGTFVHPFVGINLGQWCSPRFAVQVAKWMEELLRTGETSIVPAKPQLLIPRGYVLREKSLDLGMYREYEKIRKRNMNTRGRPIPTPYIDKFLDKYGELYRRPTQEDLRAEILETEVCGRPLASIIQDPAHFEMYRKGCEERGVSIINNSKKQHNNGKVFLEPAIIAVFLFEDSDWTAKDVAGALVLAGALRNRETILGSKHSGFVIAAEALIASVRPDRNDDLEAAYKLLQQPLLGESTTG